MNTRNRISITLFVVGFFLCFYAIRVAPDPAVSAILMWSCWGLSLVIAD